MRGAIRTTTIDAENSNIIPTTATIARHFELLGPLSTHVNTFTSTGTGFNTTVLKIFTTNNILANKMITPPIPRMIQKGASAMVSKKANAPNYYEIPHSSAVSPCRPHHPLQKPPTHNGK